MTLLLQAALAICMLLQATPPMARTQSGPYLLEYPAERPRLGRSVMEMLRTAPPLPALPAAAPAFGRPIRIILAESDAHFDVITGGAIPEWGAGVADSEAGLIVVPGYSGGRAANSNLRRVLRHELAHIALHRYLAPGRIPRWFNEGYATWAAGELDIEGEWRLRVAFALRSAPPLDSIELAWPRATEDARIAYLLSASVVSYLVRSSGEHALGLFLERWRTSHNMEQALAATYGISIDQLETYWIRDVRKRYGWLAVLTQSAVLMAGASVLMLVLLALRRRRDRRKLAVLRATELPDEPAYWKEGENAVDDAEEKGQF
ncbi:MAG TPA: peptidase MA family metallohydrolase [Longimicrobiales bacterium]|nr:peptidase MA family metallohydrolase [Longimicrobiales bacterium]